MKIGDLCQFKTNFPSADFWLIRKGSEDKVGKPVKEYSPEYIGVKVVETDHLDPGYAYYLFTYIHQQGFYKAKAKGTTKLRHITISDIKDLEIG